MITDTGAGLVFDGHDRSRAELLAEARAYLIENGVGEHAAEDATIDRPGLVARIHWGGSDIGLVQPHHELAQEVSVVHVHVPSIVAAQDAQHLVDAAAFAIVRDAHLKPAEPVTLALTRFPEQFDDGISP